MNLDPKENDKVGALIHQSQTILIIPHRSPDGDTIGSALALFNALREMGKACDIVCKDPVPEEFRFLPNVEEVNVSEPQYHYDAYFILDAGATHLTGFHESHPELFDQSLEVVNLDHHKSNDYYGRYNVVDTEAASATMVMYDLFAHLGYEISRHTATCLLTGIYTDTGSLMHSNTDARVMRTATKLLAKGADLRNLSKEVFNTTKISTMRLWGRVMRSAHQNGDKVTMSIVKRKDFEDTGADYSEMSGVVDYINSVPDSNYSVILTERDGKVKGSLRTLKEEVDVAEIASGFGGGGHTKAAGFTLPGKLEKEVRWKVIE